MKGKFRHGVALLAVLAMMLGFAGMAAAEKITITWWINPWRIAPPGMDSSQAPTAEDWPEWVSQEFMRLNPDVEVVYEVVTNAGYSEKISAAILARRPPDLMKDLVYRREWAERGLLEPIDDYIDPEDWEDWYDYALAKGQVNGKHYIFPWNNSSNGMGCAMLINPAIFEARGVKLPELPTRAWTFDEFLEAAKQLSYDEDGDGINDYYALSFAASDLLNCTAWLHVFGARMFNEDETEVIINSPEGVAGLQFMVDAIYEYQIAPKGAEGMGIYDVIGLFHQGRTAIGYGGPYEIGRIDRYVREGQLEKAFDVHIAPFPHFPEYGPVAHHTSGGFIVFRQSDPVKRDKVMEFAKFITNFENTASLKTLLYVTARKSVNAVLYEDSPFADEVSVYTAAIDHGVPFFGSEEIDFSPVNAHLQAAFEAAFARTKTPQQALDDFAKEANRILFGK
ncbi:MAG TPA: sugar ABC transporter substrate-binding protein [Firmicutes bacterium]|jgi:multiple sugar transport system substrate-binding protein|nr:MAG: ABC transporter substrate-binding protein [Peptococcaceae bacterium 1109]HHT72101.1 sugar ABC transporter substrate-binding protein [Bacillota bacterium]